MTLPLFAQLITMFAISGTAAFLALYLMSVLENRGAARLRRRERGDQVAFLYNGDRLFDATDRAREMIGPGGGDDLNELLDLLRDNYPDLELALAALPETGKTTMAALDGLGTLDLEYRDGLSWIGLKDTSAARRGRRPADDDLQAMESELLTLRSIASTAPFLVWKTDEDGRIAWANSAYIRLAQECDPSAEVPVWPPIAVFDVDADMPHNRDQDQRRISVHVPGEVDRRYFDQYASPMPGGRLFTAVSADRTVKAETALREFVQTLTKTFAHLTTGLAIFDKQRRLVLFNPALVSLTTLKPELLTARPPLHIFLDRLRDKRMIPEPRDYKSWRQQIEELESAAIEGTYEETWPLPNGQTYRVTGRPHPDGALAFMFEDKSAEISLARRYRTELETGQAVVDSFDEAIAVFSPNGSLTLSNAAYARLWGVDHAAEVVPVSVVEATRMWSTACAPSPVWGDLRDFVGAISERAEWTSELRMHDGRGLRCRFAPLAGGSTLIGFRAVKPEKLHLPPPTEAVADGRLEKDTISA